MFGLIGIMISPLTIRDDREGWFATYQAPLALPMCKAVRYTAMGVKIAVTLLLSRCGRLYVTP